MPVRVHVLAVVAIWAVAAALVVMPAGAQTSTTIAYAANNGVIIEIVGGAARQIDVPATTVAWSPDGQRIAAGSVLSNEVHVIDVASGAVRRIATDFAVEAENYGGVGELDWSSTTEVLVPTGVTGRIDGIAFDGTARRTVVPGPSQAAYFLIDAAPDGQHMITDQCDIEDAFCDGNQLRRTADGGDLGFAGLVDSAWAPNSGAIAYSVFGSVFIRAVDAPESAGVEIARTGGGTGAEIFGVEFTPDGAAVAFTDPEAGRARPWITTQLDGCCERLALDTRADGAIREFSADGTLATISAEFGLEQIVQIGVGPIPIAFRQDSAIRFAPVEPPAPQPPAPDADPANVIRYAGSERIGTAIDIFDGFTDRPEAVLVRADVAADAIAATQLAVAFEGPLLLTAGDRLSAQTAEALTRMVTPGGTVFLAGGAAALSDQVAADVQALGFVVERLAGDNRYGTAAAIAEVTTSAAATIYLADGNTFADALIAGSAAGRDDFAAMLLTAGTTLPPETAAALDGNPTSRIVAVGAEAAAAAAGLADETVVGADVYDNARILAERLPGIGSEVALASGEAFPDGLAGGADAGMRGVPLLLTRRDSLPEPTAAYLRATTPGILTVYGGTAAISTAVTQAAAAP